MTMEEPPLQWAAFLLGRFIGIVGNRRAEVFNTFVENLVEKQRSIFVSDSPRDVLTLCTASRAGTFGVEPAAKGRFG
jgi:hypothetical protein